MHAVLRVLLTLILLIAAGLLSYDLASYYLYSPWTRDARIRANVVAVAPDVSGYVDDVRVQNDQFVHRATSFSRSTRSVLGSRSQTPKLRSRRGMPSLSWFSINTSDAQSWLPDTPSLSRILITRAGSPKQQPQTTSRQLPHATPPL